MSKEIKELLQFLQLGARSNIKEVVLKQILSLTATDEGIKILVEVPEVFRCLLMLLNDNDEAVRKNSALSLVNLTALPSGVEIVLNLNLESDRLILKPPENIIKTCLMFIVHKESVIADECCMILSNVTRDSRFVEKTVNMLIDSTVTLRKLAEVFAKINYNNKGASLNHLGSVFSNLSQSARVRKEILNDKSILQKLLPFVEYKESSVRRSGVTGAVRNCCFETDRHRWLLGEDVGILPRLLLPLADGTEFDEEEMERLPVELQFLPEDKRREESSEIRCMLLEALNQLCALKESREFIRDKNAYVILRELHKWEKDPEALSACENCVDILIRTEREIGVENLREVDIERLNDSVGEK